LQSVRRVRLRIRTLPHTWFLQQEPHRISNMSCLPRRNTVPDLPSPERGDTLPANDRSPFSEGAKWKSPRNRLSLRQSASARQDRVDRLCSSCSAGAPQRSHPVGMAPLRCVAAEASKHARCPLQADVLPPSHSNALAPPPPLPDPGGCRCC
jgi:hypothetical protein